AFGWRLLQRVVGRGVDRLFAGEPLPALNRPLAVNRVEFYPVAFARGHFGTDDGAAAADKSVNHDFSWAARILERAAHQFDRLLRRVNGLGVSADLPDRAGVGAT